MYTLFTMFRIPVGLLFFIGILLSAAIAELFKGRETKVRNTALPTAKPRPNALRKHHGITHT